MGSRRTVFAALAVIAVASATWYLWPARSAAPALQATGAETRSTTTVTKTTLTTSDTVGGTLGYGRLRTLKTTKPGLVTWLPQPGAVVSQGERLYSVDDKPITLMYGGTPLYRKLDSIGMIGGDVTVVADNLKAMGYRLDAPKSGVKKETALTSSLVDAIKRYQKTIGVEPNGVLDVGDAVVLDGPVRVGAVQAQLGDSASAPLMTVSGTAKAVTVELDAAAATRVKTGDAVTITLADGTTTPGKVSAVTAPEQAAGTDSSTPAKMSVLIGFDEPPANGTADSGRVQVTFTAQTKADVLAVPVGALLAVKQGGYALQLPEGRLLPVATGLFAKGMVEVSGPDVTEGLKVVVAS
ncbi:HlyD family efflux transporter periplasmic adaptor subunit [Lentzea aerocolonigenes]|uniref:HlyD family efflux transporter periplasmic adaptor subunit n=1 Tax=Lentzea aerocolonigenes TaxID=68170 RepID=UPI0007C5136B|nr:HlyD family efflux transporter periplasmic adaptor subunit [Lentzea aerocolonigenes]MCP2248143.1 Multidrug efflux pump subunit AcrA (membrane-fusion protein) [Lentzea aerocolonigenes]